MFLLDNVKKEKIMYQSKGGIYMGIPAISGIGALKYENQYSGSSAGNKGQETSADFREILAKATAKEKSISFQICLPLDFKSESKEVLSTINQLNDYSRQNDLCEFWAMGYRGKIYLYGALIDDGLFDKMNDVVTYLVSNLLEFAEYGLGMLSNTLQSDYVPSPTEYTEMYR
jgi:hypothetical protein